MLIVDSQVHIWGADTPQRPWPKRAPPQREIPLGKDQLLRDMDEAGVDRVIIVPPSWEGDRNDLACEAAAAHPDRYAVMGRFDPDAPGARDAVAGWKKQPGMLGMRFAFHTELLREPLLAGRMDWVWDAAEKHDIPLMVLVHHHHCHLIDKVAERHPGLRLVMDHLGLMSGQNAGEEELFRDLDLLLALAKRPNIAAKASALPCYTTDVYPYRKLFPYVRRVYDAFGPKRMFWGTDFSRLRGTYRQAVTMFTEEIPWLTAEDKEWIMGRGVCAWLGWKT